MLLKQKFESANVFFIPLHCLFINEWEHINIDDSD